MKSFGCLVTILNTLDPLGKFDRKVDEGFLVGYSVSSKAFRVFNSRTQIVQETLHINFLENKHNVASSGPTWLFDIDTLTKTMNYQPVNAGNQSNPSTGIQEQHANTDEDAAFEVKEPEFEGRKPESKVHFSPSRIAQSKNHDDKTKREAKGKIPAVGQISTNNTNTFSAAGPSNAVRLNLLIWKQLSQSVLFQQLEFIKIILWHKSLLIYLQLLKQEEEVYVCQPPGFEDLNYPDKVYKVVKALYRLHQAPRA
nr:ribonuclease H-like domain-containing protein [Tanacetum cinerariifolium]GFA21503.1 ribonuclease H-like domain-containing protein [Tanacetum cinerariifolium]